MPQEAKKAVGKKTAEVDPYKAELAERIAKAFKQFNADARVGDELHQKDLGRLVSEELGLEEPITQASVSAWMNPQKPSAPSNPALRAIAKVLNVDLMWLVYGAAED